MSKKTVVKIKEDLNHMIKENLYNIKFNEKGSSKGFVVGIVAGLIILGGAVFLFTTNNNTDNQGVTGLKNSEAKVVYDNFLGEKGEAVVADGLVIKINETEVNDGNMHMYNYYSEKSEKNIYFFVLKADDGTYRVAANACEVCFGAKKGFTQVGSLIRCENCKKTYNKNSIALEKGGCNPGPIDKNAKIVSSQLIIDIDNIEAVSYLF